MRPCAKIKIFPNRRYATFTLCWRLIPLSQLRRLDRARKPKLGAPPGRTGSHCHNLRPYHNAALNTTSAVHPRRAFLAQSPLAAIRWKRWSRSTCACRAVSTLNSVRAASCSTTPSSRSITLIRKPGPQTRSEGLGADRNAPLGMNRCPAPD